MINHDDVDEDDDIADGYDHKDDALGDYDYDRRYSSRFPFCDVFVMRLRRGVWEVKLVFI